MADARPRRRFIFGVDAALYNVLNYRLGHRLPLAPVVLLLYHVSEPDSGWSR